MPLFDVQSIAFQTSMNAPEVLVERRAAVEPESAEPEDECAEVDHATRAVGRRLKALHLGARLFIFFSAIAIAH